MNNLVVNKALSAFNEGEFGMAKSLYLELTKLIGKDIFKANIHICDRKLKAGLGYSSPQVQLQKLKVACVMDEFSYTNFHAECHFFQLSPKAWQRELADFKPDFLFIESAWRGKDDQWSSKIGHTSAELLGMVAWCNEQGIPTVFWNKEDPVHFETFLNTAKLFDHVFTTDIDCIQRYKAALKHDRVGLLLFACQPSISNPLEHTPARMRFVLQVPTMCGTPNVPKIWKTSLVLCRVSSLWTFTTVTLVKTILTTNSQRLISHSLWAACLSAKLTRLTKAINTPSI